MLYGTFKPLRFYSLRSLPCSTISSVLTITPGYRVTPPAVRLTDGPVRGPGERHPLLAPEGDDRVESGPAALQPAVGEDARGATVDLWIIVRYLHQYRLGQHEGE